MQNAAGEFQGKTAFVTGGGSGIGAVAARLLAQRGARVMIADIDDARAAEVAAQIDVIGGRALSCGLDVTDATSVQRAVARTEDEFGGLQCCANNAGIATPAFPLAEVPSDEWSRQIAVNLTGVFHCMQAQLPALLRHGGGAIVNTASIAGVVGIRDRGAYAAAKHGVVGLTRTAALDYAESGVRVNAIAPGYVDTQLLAGRSAEERGRIAARHPMNRMATPTEIAEGILFLLGDRAGFVTGTVLGVDGGFTAQ